MPGCPGVVKHYSWPMKFTFFFMGWISNFFLGYISPSVVEAVKSIISLMGIKGEFYLHGVKSNLYCSQKLEPLFGGMKFTFLSIKWNSLFYRMNWNSPLFWWGEIRLLFSGVAFTLFWKGWPYEVKFTLCLLMKIWVKICFSWSKTHPINHEEKLPGASDALLISYLKILNSILKLLNALFGWKITVLYAFLEWNKNCFWFGCN